MHILGHFKTITHHKLLVMGYCFRVGLIRQGLLHDLSKYSPTEFMIGARYYTGTKSPNAAERDDIGYSTAWMHHKGRNKHHLEYWTDYCGPNYEITGQPMPTKYMVEMCLDRIAACKVYHGKDYTDRDPLQYLNTSNDAKLLHPSTRVQVVEILNMLAEEGEQATFKYLRNVVLKNPVKLYTNRTEAASNPGDKDETFVGVERVRQLADEIGTPFYLYDASGICEAAETVNRAFSIFHAHRQFFPVKATPTAGILKLLKDCGSGAVCSSAAELELCARCGFQGSEILFLPNYPRAEDIAAAAKLGCMPIMDGPDQLMQFAQAGLLGKSVGVRLIPEEPFRFGRGEARVEAVKFGMTVKQVTALLPELKKHGVTSLGLHAYLSGNTMEEQYYPALAEFLCECALKLSTEIPIDYLNISGGLGIPYMPGQRAMKPETLAVAVKKVIAEKLTSAMVDEIQIFTELGRFITGPSGVLVTEVNSIKHGARDYAGVDASAADLMRPMLYDAYHHISVVGKEGVKQRSKWDVVGAVCENTDKFAVNRLLPELQRGDLLLIHDAGAHGHSMGYNYGGRLRCGEYLLNEDKSVTLLRRAQTIDDYLETQVF